MQKNVLTKAVAVALATLGAGGAMAQSSVTLYGTLDGSISNTQIKKSAIALQGAAASSTNVTGVSNGLMTPSYIGFRGVEDLGGGLEVSFKLESYLDLDTGATSDNQLTNSPLSIAGTSPDPFATTAYNVRDQGVFWARNAYVGLKTNFGLFRLGQMDSLGYLSNEQFSPFGGSKLAPSRIFYQTDNYTQGWSNAVAYFAKVGNFGGAAMYSAKETSTATDGLHGAKWAAAVGYFTDQFSASLGFEKNKASVGQIEANLPATTESWLLNSFYDFGVAKIYAQYGYGTLERAPLAAADVTSTGFQVGASVPLGSQAKFLVSYSNGVLKLGSDTPATASIEGLKARDVKIFTVGGTYDLSKRTNVYAVYSTDKSDYQRPQPNGLAIFDTKENTFAVGVRHSF